MFAAVDRDGNKIVSGAEAGSVTVKILGYSWGAVAALGLAINLNRTGLIRVGGTPKNPVQYRLWSTIPVDTLVLIDLIAILNWPTSPLPSNVKRFRNYYQTRGKNSMFVDAAPPHNPAGIDQWGYNWSDFGYAMSRKWKGAVVPNASGTDHIQIDVTTYCPKCYTPWHNPNLGKDTWLFGPEANHTTMTLYVNDLVYPLML